MKKINYIHQFVLISFLIQLNACAPWIDTAPMNPPAVPALIYDFDTKLPVTSRVEGDLFGDDIALAADGRTLVIGAHGDGYSGDSPGAAYIYFWNETGWQEQKIVQPDGIDGDTFGRKVSLSQDGRTAVICAVNRYSLLDCAYIYHLTDGQWLWTGTKITPYLEQTEDHFTVDILHAANGNTILVQVLQPDGKYALNIYKYTANQWEETGFILPDVLAKDGYISNVSLSADGQTVLVGAGLNRGTGCAYLYEWLDDMWLETQFAVGGGEAEVLYDCHVALSADGQTALLGVYSPNKTTTGNVYISRRQDSRWETSEITAAQKTEVTNISVSLSADGQTILVGQRGPAGEDLYYSGAACVYKYHNKQWLKSTLIVPAVDEDPWDDFGYNVTLSADGRMALAGIRKYWGAFFQYEEVYLYRYRE